MPKQSPTSTLDRFVRGLSLTRHGKEALDAAEAADTRLAERQAARASLDAAHADEPRVPPLADAVTKAETAYATGVERLTRELHAARSAYSSLADSIYRRRGRAEATLRWSADPLVAENGPVVSGLWAAIERVRRFQAGADEARALLSMEKNCPVRSDEEQAFFNARTRAALADRADEIRPALEEALERVRALQLDVEVDPADVRRILAALPEQAPDGTPLNLTTALGEVSTPPNLIH